MFMDWKMQHSNDIHFTKLSCRFNAIPINIAAEFFYGYRQADPKIYLKGKGTRIAKVLWKKTEVGGVILPYFKIYSIQHID